MKVLQTIGKLYRAETTKKEREKIKSKFTGVKRLSVITDHNQ